MKAKSTLIALILSLFYFSCNQEKEPEVKNYWPNAGVTYEIFVQSFYDSDGDGIGDFNGVTEKLDYVQEL